MSNVNDLGQTGARPPAAVVNTNDPGAGGGSSLARQIAVASVSVSGSGSFAINNGFASLVKTTTGVWTLTPASPLPADTLVTVSLVGGVPGSVAASVSGGNVVVKTWDSAGNPADLRNFSLIVYDATPA